MTNRVVGTPRYAPEMGESLYIKCNYNQFLVISIHTYQQFSEFFYNKVRILLLNIISRKVKAI